MGRSQIIRDLANGIIDATTALKRTKVLLHFLNKDDNVIKWIKSELEGYGDTDEVPYYRTWDGQLRGTYICGTAYSNIRGKNQPLPVGNLSKEIRERILSINIRDSVSSIIDTPMNTPLVVSLPAEYNSILSKATGNPFMIITSAYVTLEISKYKAIPTVVESKLLDILLFLEEKFGNLDSYDTPNENEINLEDQKLISVSINAIIFNKDESVTIGDENTIDESTIASTVIGKTKRY